MNITTQSSDFRSFPPVDDAIAFFASINYKKHYNQFINVAAIVCAVAMVVGTRLLNAIITFWEVNGDVIIAKANRAVDYGYMAAAVTYNAGKTVGERYYSFRDLVKQVSA